ncbi:MAG: hypothetical protein KKF16_07040 [Euryarchaeota archaeon]|nr:hypothetical protein [Euryarchaeota archaeon]MBU4608146.1 hypothetical protein [Euryarchaeota archaeon]MBV1728944.1 hypothetical protein [Methanobacterium sp.]MBV1755006.1 hypothetical protein [Methanobacterium sp.]
MTDTNLEKLKKALDNRECTINQQSKVMEITFKKEVDAEWFENICLSRKGESALSCMMSLKPPGKNQFKFIFNITDIECFIEIMNRD